MELKAPFLASRAFRVTHWQLLAISIPMSLAYLTTPLLGLVDTAVVGQFRDAAMLGGLAAGAVVFDLIFGTFNFLRSGTTGLVAQAFGRGDALEQKAVFWRASIVAAISGVALVLLASSIAAICEWFMNAEQAVTSAMDLYIRIRLISAPAILINCAILGYLLGCGNAVLGLLLQLLVNGVNLALSIFLALHLGWGIVGVAWAAVCGETAAMIVGMTIILRRFRGGPKMSCRKAFNMAEMRRMFHLNGGIMTRSVALMGAYILFARQGAQLGTLTLAANSVLMHFFLLAGYFLDGLSAAAEQLAGRAIGARCKSTFSRAVRLTGGWGFALAGFASTVVFAFGEQLIRATTNTADVRSEAVAYLPWAAFASLSSVLAIQMNGVFTGATWSRELRNTMLISLAAFIAALFTFGPLFGNHGLWAALHIFLLMRGICLLLVMRRRICSEFDE